MASMVRAELVRNTIRKYLTAINMRDVGAAGAERQEELFRARQTLVDAVLGDEQTKDQLVEFSRDVNRTFIVVTQTTLPDNYRIQLARPAEQPALLPNTGLSLVFTKVAEFDHDDRGICARLTAWEIDHTAEMSVVLDQLFTLKLLPACAIIWQYIQPRIATFQELNLGGRLGAYYQDATTMLGELRTMFNRNAMLEKRIVVLYGPITQAKAQAITEQLAYLAEQDAITPIHLYIDSKGGDVTAALDIHDAMQDAAPPVHTWCVGSAFSMASMLLLVGAPGGRYALVGSLIMCHAIVYELRGKLSSSSGTRLQSDNDRWLRTQQRVNCIYSKRLGWNLDLSSLEGDHYLTPDQAVQRGFIDAICHPDALQ